jgi:zinc transport system substrate-binding protein
MLKMNLVVLGVSVLLWGCSSNENVKENANAIKKANSIKVVTSFYPMYEFSKQVVGDAGEVVNLIPAGVEPHDWEPSPQDMKEIESADVLIYNGGGMEGWVDKVVDSVNNKDLLVVEASKGLDLMEAAEEEDHDGEEHKDEEHEEGREDEHDNGGLDPHVWLSPVLAAKEVRVIQEALAEKSPENKDVFANNANAYVEKLEMLDQKFREQLKDVKHKEFVVQHAAFGYMGREYGLIQVPIAGLAPDQEPSAERMAEIVEFSKEHGVKTIFFETLVSSKVSEAIAKEVGARTIVLNPLEGLTEEELNSNLDYLQVMENNMKALKEGLSE